MRFIKGEAAIRHKDLLIIADLHIGWGDKLYERGYIIPDEIKEFENRIMKIKKNAKKLVILGDVKDSIGYGKDIPKAIKFLRDMEEIFDEVILVRGNHDGGLNYPKVDEYNFENVKMIHGHMWPNELKSEILIMGHIHPAFKLPSGRKIPVWLIGKLGEIQKYDENRVKEVIVMPAFNKWVTGSEKIQGPIMKYFKLDKILDLELRILSEEQTDVN